jgi:hypothetical protein
VTDEQSAETSQLSTLIGSRSVRWPDEDGPWQITAYWGMVDGRPAMVGLDVRSFTGSIDFEDEEILFPVSDDLAEITQRVMRGISISHIREHTRTEIAMGLMDHYSAPNKEDGSPPDFDDFPVNHMDPADRASREEQFMALTAKGKPRQRRPAAGDAVLREVARLYELAVSTGDKMPAKFVEQRLREAGTDLPAKGSRVLVRQWIRRSRERGYLTVRPPTNQGA